MNVTLIGSGTRDNRMMSGFKGVIPWENLYEYQEFISKHINQQVVVVSLETFKNPFFKHLMLQAQARILIIAKDQTMAKDENVLQVHSSLRSALMYAPKYDLSKIIILTSSFAEEALLKEVSEVFFMRIDMIIGDGEHQFPNLQKHNFRMVSTSPRRVEKPNTLFIRNRCDASFIVQIEIQHWLPKEKPRGLPS